MAALATILVSIGVVRLTSSLVLGDDCGRRSAVNYLAAAAAAASLLL